MDDVDREIISQLQTSGRSSYESIGKKIGYTGMGVKKRVEKLLREGAIKISALMNLKYFKLYAAVVLIETDGSETTSRLLERFRSCPRLVHMFTTVGGYNIIALVVAENRETFENISMEECSLRSEKGIRRSEFYPISEAHYFPFLPVREHLTHRDLTIPPCNVDCKICERYESRNCVRCPSTEYYLGSL